MPIQVSFSTDNLTPEEARWIASLVQPAEVDLSQIEPLFRPHFEHVGERLREVLDSVASEEAVSNAGAGDFSVEGIVVANPAPLTPEELNIEITTDRNGLPWDERIHASSKALNADGSWRTKRGVDKALVASVEAELRAHEQNLSASDDDLIAQAKPLELPAAVYVPEVQLPVEAQEAKAEMVVPPPPPPAPPAPIFPVPSNPTLPGTSTFVALMKRVTTAQSAGKLTQPRVKDLLESMEKKSIMDLRTDEDAQAAFGLLLDGEGV